MNEEFTEREFKNTITIGKYKIQSDKADEFCLSKKGGNCGLIKSSELEPAIKELYNKYF